MAANGQPVLGSLYVYAPNKGAPIFFTIAYAISAIGHIWQCFKYRAWGLTGLQSLCGVLFTVGYALRVYGAFDHYLFLDPSSDEDYKSLIVFIVSQVFIFICPPVLELANYHVLGRTLLYVPHLAPLRPSRVLSTFGGLMLIVEALNAVGVSLKANSSSSASRQAMGGNMITAAVSLQVVVIAIFAVIAGTFHIRCSKVGIVVRTVLTPLMTLYVSMGLIFVRCVYRLVEHAGGGTTIDFDNIDALNSLTPLLKYEYWFYIFEAVLMLLNSALWNIWHPSRFLPRDRRMHLAADSKTVVFSADKDNRTRMQKVGHVLTSGVFFQRKMVEGTELHLYDRSQEG